MRHDHKPTRLELHRLKFHASGERGALLTYASLNKLEKSLIQAELLKDIRVSKLDFTGDMDEIVYDRVLAELLSKWGIMCPHEVLDEDDDTNDHPVCLACGSIVFWGKIRNALKISSKVAPTKKIP